MKKLVVLIFSFFVFIKVNALTIAPIDVTDMDLTEIKQALDTGVITSEQLVNIYLERIDQYDKNYKSIIYTNKSALEEAKRLDEKRLNGEIVGPLHGIPIIVKANIDVKGIPTTAGALALKDNYPNENSAVVQKLVDAGAIILASSNMSQFAFNATESASSYGAVKNAYNTKYSSYGSSGGSAVATALSFAAASLGTDTNSSIRVPASAAGLIGFRPTYGLIDINGIIAYDIYRDVVGPITKSIRDNALLMEILTGNEYTNKLSATNLKNKKIGVPTELYKGSNNDSLTVNKKTYEPITSLMEEAIAKLKNAGAEIIYIDKLYTSYYYNIARNTMSGGSMCDEFNNYIKNTTGTIRSFNDLANSSSKIYDLTSYNNACGMYLDSSDKGKAKKSEYENYITEIFTSNNLDAIIYPTTKNKISTLSNNQNSLNSPSSNLASVIGFPALSTLLGYIDNIPYGIEFLGLKNSERLLYEITNVYENDIEYQKPEKVQNLYEINENIQELVTNYYKLLENKDKKSNQNLISEIKSYFTNYENNENRITDAISLNEKNISENKNLDFGHFVMIVILVICIILFIFKTLPRKIKRKILRRKRSVNNKKKNNTIRRKKKKKTVKKRKKYNKK